MIIKRVEMAGRRHVRIHFQTTKGNVIKTIYSLSLGPRAALTELLTALDIKTTQAVELTSLVGREI